MKELDKILSDIAARIDASDNDANRERLKEYYRTSLEPLINQEVERRIAERMPRRKTARQYAATRFRQSFPYERSLEISAFIDGFEFIFSRLTSSEKPNNSIKDGVNSSQKTERQMWHDIQNREREGFCSPAHSSPKNVDSSKI